MSAPTASEDRRIEVPVDVLFRELGGESVLLDLRTESYFGLDPVGTRMWHALAETGSVSGALGALGGAWDVEPARLRRDLERLVDELAEHGLVVLAPA
jgi:hypothetical protein